MKLRTLLATFLLVLSLLTGGREAYAYTGGKAFDPSLPCLVLVHGAINDHSVWTLIARWFAHHGWSVLAPDLPGHMRSAGPALPNVEALADWLLALLDAAGVQQAALAGKSMGSLVIHPASTTHFRMDDAALAAAGIGAGTIRLSIGLEDADDLIEDLKHALKTAQRAT